MSRRTIGKLLFQKKKKLGDKRIVDFDIIILLKIINDAFWWVLISLDVFEWFFLITHDFCIIGDDFLTWNYIWWSMITFDDFLSFVLIFYLFLINYNFSRSMMIFGKLCRILRKHVEFRRSVVISSICDD